MFDESYFITETVTRREVKKFFINYQLKNQTHSVSIDLSCSGFSFYENVNRQFAFLIHLFNILQFFYIPNRTMSKGILYQYFGVFCPACDSFSSENILHVIT